MLHGGPREPAGDLIQLIDRPPNLGERSERLVRLGHVDGHPLNRRATPAPKLRLDEFAEIPG